MTHSGEVTFTHLKAGDKATRILAGVVSMTMIVDRVDDKLIHTTGGWMFERNTGAEYDPDLGWGTEYGHTGSYLVDDS